MFIGRLSSQRGLPRSRVCNTYKLTQVGRELAISEFREELYSLAELPGSLRVLSGTRRVCHGDIIFAEFAAMCQGAFGRDDPNPRPGKPVLVETGYTSTGFCAGQSMGSPGRWPIHSRKYLSSSAWLVGFGGQHSSASDEFRSGQSRDLHVRR